MQLCRQVLDSLLPPGTLWQPEPDEGFDLLLDGIAANMDSVRLFLHGLSKLRNPYLTNSLADLEREYGLLTNSLLTEDERRQRLAGVIYGASNDGSADFMQSTLQRAGFSVYVHQNNPPVNPLTFMNSSGGVFGKTTSRFGTCRFGSSRIEPLVNGIPEPAAYTLPAEPEYWPLFFFVGGPATRNDDGELTAISRAEIPASRKAEFLRTIVQLKPLHTWAGVIVNYV